MTPVTLAMTDARASAEPTATRAAAGPGIALHVGLDASTGVAGHMLMVDLAQALMGLIAEIAPGAVTHAALALGDRGPQRELVARFGAELAAQVPGARPSVKAAVKTSAATTSRRADEARTTHGTQGASDAPRAQVVVDLGAREVTVDGMPVPLANRELELLAYLLRAPHRAVPRTELLATVWGKSVPADGSRTIDVHVRRLREKLGGCLQIVTVRGVGYRCDPTPEIVLVGSGDAD